LGPLNISPRKPSYQTRQKLPILEDNHNRPLPVFMGLSGDRLTYPDGIGKFTLKVDN